MTALAFGLGQRHRGKAGSPEAGAVAATAQFRETAAQYEGECRGAGMQPVPPPARRMADDAGAACRVAQRGAGQQVQQNPLLFGPRVPAARRDAQRETRARKHRSSTEGGNRKSVCRSTGIKLLIIASLMPTHR